MKPIVAVFDFDGTITTTDVLLPFLYHWNGVAASCSQMALLTPYFLGFITGAISRQTLKEALAHRLFAGRKSAELRTAGEAFANSPTLARMMRKEALQKIRWHREQGHRLILASAAFELYLPFWGPLHGFSDVICTRLAVTPAGEMTGSLLGNNCWGAEKVHRLEALLGPREGYTVYAYGNSRGDRELLDWADFGAYKPFK